MYLKGSKRHPADMDGTSNMIMIPVEKNDCPTTIKKLVIKGEAQR